jgi:hypothetical protein
LSVPQPNMRLGMNDDKTEHYEQSVARLETARDVLKRRRERHENFRTAMLVLAVVCLSASLVVPFFLYIYNPRWATLAVVAGLGHSAILFAFVLVAGARVENLADQIQLSRSTLTTHLLNEILSVA